MQTMCFKLGLTVVVLLTWGQVAAQSTTTLATGANNPAAGNIPRGAINAPLAQFNHDRAVGTGNLSFTALTLINTGTAVAPDYNQYRLYRDTDGTGTNDNTGFHFATFAYTVTYTIANVGQAALNLTGTPLISVGALTNCTASLTTPPSTPVGAAVAGAVLSGTLTIVTVGRHSSLCLKEF